LIDVAAAFCWNETEHSGLGAEFVKAVEAAIDPIPRFPGASFPSTRQ
jgi:hypothetical protein